jgi:hypothetical protein
LQTVCENGTLKPTERKFFVNRLGKKKGKTDGTENFSKTVGKMREKSQTEEKIPNEPSEK